jgi:hypothetical protein
MKLEISRPMFEKKKAQISNCIKVCPVGPELSHADGQRDTTKLLVAFCNFANAPKDRSSTACILLTSKDAGVYENAEESDQTCMQDNMT